MARCYSRMMPRRQPLPKLWVISDARNDAVLDRVLRRLPRGAGLIFRHYHMPEAERLRRFAMLERIARSRGHLVALSGNAAAARRRRADAAYGSPRLLARGGPVLRLVTVHSLRELGQARRADAVLLSPVHPTRSHPGGAVLGPVRFRLLAARARVPVIALGGMDRHRARSLKWPRWAGIDAFLR